MSASITNSVNYSLKPTSVKCHRKTINVPASNKLSFNPGDTAVFYLPSLKHNVMDGLSGFLKFKVAITSTGTCYPNSSAHAFINRISTYGSGGQLISDINNYSSLATAMLDLQLSQSDKIGLSPILGTEEESFTCTDATGALGTPLAAALEAVVPKVNRRGKPLSTGISYSFCLPLLHPLFAMSEKAWPVFSLSDDTRIELEWSTAAKALVGTGTNFVISQAEIITDYIEFDEAVFPLIASTYAGRDIIIPSQDYHYYSSILASTGGNVSQIIPVKCQSARMAMFRFRPAETQVGTEYQISSSVNPFWSASDYFNLNIGGSRVRRNLSPPTLRVILAIGMLQHNKHFTLLTTLK